MWLRCTVKMRIIKETDFSELSVCFSGIGNGGGV